MKQARVKEIFIKLKRGHELWKINNEEYRGKLLKAFEPFFVELEELGVDRHFSESLLFFGEEFVGSFKSKNNEEKITDEDLEDIWGAKPVKKTDKEMREAELARKYNAETWVGLPMKGDSVRIRVLTYKEK